MHLKHLYAAILLSFLYSCQSSNPAQELPPDQWIVVGNDRGLRNEFVDMANIIDLEPGNLKIRSAAIPQMELNYAIQDSIVLGPREERWKMKRVNQDTVTLFDSIKNNHYYLERLAVVSLDSSWRSYPEGKQFTRSNRWGTDQVLFEERGNQDLGCYAMSSYREVGTQRIRRSQDDGRWRLEDRFNQPILAYTIGGSKDIVMLIDSIVPGDGIHGKRIDNNILNYVQRDAHYAEVADEEPAGDPKAMLAKLDFAATKVELVADSLMERYTIFNFNGSLPENIINVSENDLADLWLLLDEAGYAINVGENNLREGSFYFHESASFVVVNGGCLNDNYLPYKIFDEGITISVPINYIRPTAEPSWNQNPGGHPFEGVAYFMTEVEITIPFLASLPPSQVGAAAGALEGK